MEEVFNHLIENHEIVNPGNLVSSRNMKRIITITFISGQCSLSGFFCVGKGDISGPLKGSTCNPGTENHCNERYLKHVLCYCVEMGLEISVFC